MKTMAMAGSGIVNSGQALGQKYYQQQYDHKGPNQGAAAYGINKQADAYGASKQRGSDFKKSAKQMFK